MVEESGMSAAGLARGGSSFLKKSGIGLGIQLMAESING